ncbi:MAG: hypothetical protein HY786_06755, partial [Deltaproteobacteria bacterium]|nr:hypothetical protein [Deltaproteobacteria bacterium]
EKIKITDRGLHIIAREADGGMRDAQSILDQVISFAGEDVSDEDVAKSLGVIDREALINVVKSIMERTPAGCIQVVERVYDYGYDVRLFCKNLLEYIRNLTVLKVIKYPGQLIDLPDGEIADIKTLADGFSQDELQQLFAILSRGDEELKRSSSPRLSLEMTLIKMATLRPLIPVSELLERVKGLEQGIGKARSLERKEDEKIRSLEDEKKILTSQPLNLSTSQLHNFSIPAREEKVEAHMELEEPGDTWKSFMQLVRKKRPPLASKLEHGRLIELSDTEVRVGFDKGIYLDMISKEEIKALEEMLNVYLSRSMKVVIAPLVKERKVQEPVKKEQTRHPIIEEALKVFGGRIVAENMASN